ncbi:MAG: amidohydrolase family protein [Opitutus sp.]
MRVIDSHVHLYPREANNDPAQWGQKHGETAWVEMSTRYRRSGIAVQGFPSVDDLLREMDTAGVERSVLLGWYWANAETCRTQNGFYAECVREHPSRFFGFATLQPAGDAEGAIAEMKRARDAGLIGLGELSPHAQQYAIDDPGFAEVLQLAEDWSWPVNLHVTDPAGRAYPGRVETPPEDFVRLAQTYPKVPFILAHWGGLLPLRDPAAAQLTNLYYDTAASPLLYDKTVWSRFLAVVPKDHVLFGSDFPLNVYPTMAVKPEMARFLAEAQGVGVSETIFSGNVERLLIR